MYEPPTVFYCDGENTEAIFADLKQAGYSSEEITFVKLDEVQWEDAKQIIDEGLRTPFIYFPVENKTDWTRVGKLVAGGVAVGIVSVAAAPVVLGAIGFSSAGVAGGSIAAATQSAVYGGATGGLFAVLQSAGAAGIGIFGNTVIGLIGTGAGAGITAAITSDIKKALTNELKIKTIGIYKSSSKERNINEINDFIRNQLQITSVPKLIMRNRSVDNFLSSSLSRAQDHTGESKNLEVHLPAVIVFF